MKSQMNTLSKFNALKNSLSKFSGVGSIGKRPKQIQGAKKLTLSDRLLNLEKLFKKPKAKVKTKAKVKVKPKLQSRFVTDAVNVGRAIKMLDNLDVMHWTDEATGNKRTIDDIQKELKKLQGHFISNENVRIAEFKAAAKAKVNEKQRATMKVRHRKQMNKIDAATRSPEQYIGQEEKSEKLNVSAV